MARGLFVRTLAIGIALAFLSQGAEAHTGGGIAGGFWSGVLHPVTGWDHVVAMVAVGLWGAFLGRPAIWVLPVVFPLVMAFGGAMGVLGIPLPRALLPGDQSFEYEADGRFVFDVEIGAPGVGRIVHYRGTLQPG